MTQENITPKEASFTHEELIYRARLAQETAVSCAKQPDLDVEFLDLSIDVKGANNRVGNFAKDHFDQLFVAALAEAALAGVQINHPRAIQVTRHDSPDL